MLVLIVKVGKEVWEQCVISPNSIIIGNDLENIMQYSSSIEFNDLKQESSSDGKNYLLMQEKNDYFIQAVHIIKMCSCLKHLLSKQGKSLNISMDTHLLSCFLNELTQSEIYRRNIISNFLDYCILKKDQYPIKCDSTDNIDNLLHLRVVVHLMWPEMLKIDYSWNDKMERLELEKLELENLMAWLSTLGGAYSALGEDFTHFAENAGKISLQQLKIALKLGDPIISAKCKVYFSISLIQRGYLEEPMKIIQEQYAFAKSLHENLRDIRLLKMCKGVWAKMQYLYSLRKKNVQK